MPKRSILFQRLVLVLAALAFLGAAVWVGLRIFEPIAVPSLPPARTRVTFDPQADIRRNPLFQTLRGLVTGEVLPGILGRPNPFVGPPAFGPVSMAQSARLATIERVDLGGGQALFLQVGLKGGMLVLISGLRADGSTVYEIRHFTPEGLPSTFASWTVQSGTNLRPVALAQVSDELILLGAGNGQLGRLARGSLPVWEALEPGLKRGSIQDLRRDGAGRMWITDGRTAFIRDNSVLQSFEPSSALTEAERSTLAAELSTLPDQLRPFGVSGAELVQNALLIKRLIPQRNGEMGMVTDYVGLIMPERLTERPQLLDPLATSSLALVLSPRAELWARRHTDDSLVQLWATGTRAFADPFSYPRRALQNPQIFAFDAERLYALDYQATSTVLWQTADDGWIAQVVAASGTLPVAAPRRVEVDGEGGVWAVLDQGGLVRVRPKRRGDP